MLHIGFHLLFEGYHVGVGDLHAGPRQILVKE
jgi:hypothetical protein